MENYYGVAETVAKAYLSQLNAHIAAVQEAGIKLGVPDEQLRVHDASKFTADEFPYYARQMFGDKGDPLGFAYAWLAHQNRNKHHWEFYIMRTEHSRLPASPRI